MITEFERDTQKLSGYEKNEVLPAVMKVLERCIGKRKAISNSQLMRQHLSYYVVDPARLRKVINYIRNNFLIKGLMASSKGYYIAESREELKRYVKSLDGRIHALRNLREHIVMQMNNMFPDDNEENNKK